MMRLHMWGLRKSRRKLIKNYNEKFWKCPHCEKLLSIPKTLFHVLIHSLEKPFRCSECRTRFAELQDFDEHRQAHAAERLNAKRAQLARDKEKSIQLEPKKKRSRASELQVVAVKPGYVYHTVTTRSGRAVRQMIQVAIKNRSKSSTCDVTLPKIKEEHTRLTKSENVDTPTGRIYCGLCPKSYRGILQLRLHLQTDHSCTTMTTGNNTEQQNKMPSKKEVHMDSPELTGNWQLCRKIMTKYRKLGTVQKNSDGGMNTIARETLFLKTTLRNSVAEPSGNRLFADDNKAEKDGKDLLTNGPANQGRIPSHDFRCNYCSSSFVNLYEYQLHVADHEGHAKFDCQVCDSSFLAENHLRSHLNAIHKISATL